MRKVQGSFLASRPVGGSPGINVTDVAWRSCPVAAHRGQPFAKPHEHWRRCGRVTLVQDKQVVAREVLHNGDVSLVMDAITVEQVNLRYPEPERSKATMRRCIQVDTIRSRELVCRVSDTRPVGPEVLRLLPQVRDRRRAIIHGQPVNALLGTAGKTAYTVQLAPSTERRAGRPGQVIPDHGPRRHAEQLLISGRNLSVPLDYAIELGLLETNPIRALKWTVPKVSSQVDRRSVVNPRQARALLAAVRAQQPSGPMLVVFFAVMYYAGLRPEEAINLRVEDVLLPQHAQDNDRWGELHLRSATPDAGRDSTDDGSTRERRQLKHRAEGDSRIVPAHPELARLLRDHLEQFSTAPNGRMFSGVRRGELRTITYQRAWIKARQTALTAAEQASPLARRPYDLRHACLST